jgi:hypothetical protein
MSRKRLDLIISVGGVATAILFLVLGFVFRANGTFARDYVKDQLTAQEINFPATEALTDEEATVECLTEFAGTVVDSGEKAECYANEYIGAHLAGIGKGETYASLGTPQRELRDKVAAAEAAGAADLETLKADLAAVNATRESMFKGETLRGLLLTTYGFSIFGEKAMQAAFVGFLVAAVMFVAAIAGFIHAARTKV